MLASFCMGLNVHNGVVTVSAVQLWAKNHGRFVA